jgi:glucose-6-phosphate 1-dehydrogenase
MKSENSTIKVLIEKPAGHSRKEARLLLNLLRRFPLLAPLHVDHYLGKHAVENLLVFRMVNRVFAAQWNRSAIDQVQICIAEDAGIGNRAGYYDHVGCTLDMIQSHLFQILCLVAMEPIATLTREAMQAQKVRLLNAISLSPADVVRGQYTAGEVNGTRVPGYLEEQGVAPGSKTETYVMMRLRLNTVRWRDVPFVLCTGKRLARRLATVQIRYKPMPLPGGLACHNLLTFRLQPDPAIFLHVGVLEPGQQTKVQMLPLACRFADFFQETPEAYERLLADALRGDATFFPSEQEIEASFRLLQPVLDSWASTPTRPFPYPAGSWGPAEAETLLLARDGRRWLPV